MQPLIDTHAIIGCAAGLGIVAFCAWLARRRQPPHHTPTMTPTHRKFRAGDIVCFKHRYIIEPSPSTHRGALMGLFALNPGLKFCLSENQGESRFVRLPDNVSIEMGYVDVLSCNLRLIEPAEPDKAEREAKLERIQASIRDLQRQVDELRVSDLGVHIDREQVMKDLGCAK